MIPDDDNHRPPVKAASASLNKATSTIQVTVYNKPNPLEMVPAQLLRELELQIMISRLIIFEKYKEWRGTVQS